VGVGSYVGDYTCGISIYPRKGSVDCNRDGDTYISTFEVTKGE